MGKELEKSLEKKVDVKEIVDEAMHKYLGVSIDELSEDISEKLKKSPLLDMQINTSLSFKESKRRFKQAFLKKMLRVSYGNISEVAKRAGVDRRSIHRIVKEAGIDVDRIREDMIKPYEIKQKAVGNIIEDVLAEYRTVIHPDRIKGVYANVPSVSKDILDDLPEQEISLKEAEEEFEKAFIRRALEDNKGSITKTAQAIDIRYETLLRKMKSLGLK